MRINIHQLVLCLAIVLLASCGRTAPQRPSQRNSHVAVTEADSTTMALLEFNMKMVGLADKQVADYVQQQDTAYAQLLCGAWATWLIRTDDGETPVKDDQCRIRMVVRKLTDELLMDTERTVVIQHEELPVAVEEAVAEMHRGEMVRLVAPWYTAYGIEGTSTVNGYENVLIEVQLVEL